MLVKKLFFMFCHACPWRKTRAVSAACNYCTAFCSCSFAKEEKKEECVEHQWPVVALCVTGSFWRIFCSPSHVQKTFEIFSSEGELKIPHSLVCQNKLHSGLRESEWSFWVLTKPSLRAIPVSCFLPHLFFLWVIKTQHMMREKWKYEHNAQSKQKRV